VIVWNNLTSDEILELDRNLPVIIPIGLIESHGPHMTVSFDNDSADYFSRKISEKANVILAPLISYGFADANREYPGTIGITPRTLTLLIRDICEMFCYHGFEKIIILSGHGANKMPCELAFYEVWEKYKGFKPVYWNWWEAAGIQGIHHADKGETEVALAIGAMVHMSRVKDFSVAKTWHKERSRYETMPDSGGINGEPSKANLNNGCKIRDAVIEILSDKLIKIKEDVK